MHTRIKYEFTGPVGVSRQKYTIETGEYVVVVVNKEEFYFEIQNSDGKAIMRGGKTKNYGVLLRQAKRALEKLGYNFAIEERDRDFGVVRKQEQV